MVLVGTKEDLRESEEGGKGNRQHISYEEGKKLKAEIKAQGRKKRPFGVGMANFPACSLS